MQRISLVTWLVILVVIALMFGFWVNQKEPIIEVTTDNRNQVEQPVQPVAPPPPVEMKVEVYDPCGPFSRFSNPDCPPVTTVVPDYPVPYDDGDIQWDGVKVDGWDDDAPEWPAPSNTAGADHYNDAPRPDWLENGD